MFNIRDFGNDRTANSEEELKTLLVEHYKGRSVAIHTTKPSGITSVDYVDVLDDGKVVQSYGGQPYFKES